MAQRKVDRVNRPQGQPEAPLISQLWDNLSPKINSKSRTVTHEKMEAGKSTVREEGESAGQEATWHAWKEQWGGRPTAPGAEARAAGPTLAWGA